MDDAQGVPIWHPVGTMSRLRRIIHMTAALALAVAAPAAAQTPPPLSPREQQAAQFFQAADLPKAVAAYQEVVAAEAQNPRAWFGLGVALHDSGTYPAAREALLKAQALGYQPANQVRVRLARTHIRLGETTTALDLLDQLAAGGFANIAALQAADFAPVRDTARFAALQQRVTQNARPCESDPRFRRFDFWIGEWDVQATGAPRAPVGAASHVTRDLDGCVILEHWVPPSAPAGKSFNIFNTSSGKWEQYWVDARGTITHYIGEFREDGHLYYEATQFGSTNKVRMTFFNQGPDQVRQLGHLSTDGGKTWTVSFDLTYLRKK